MEQVVELIRTALPSESKDDGEEIEIPLDELDTHTLRKLQKFVAVMTNKNNIYSDTLLIVVCAH